MFNFSIGTWEILIIVFIVLLLFGGKRIPKIVRRIAKGWHDIQNMSRNAQRDIEDALGDSDDLMG